MHPALSHDLLRAICLKVAFKPESLRRAQAALLYIALTGREFTADILPAEITNGDSTLAGCAIGSLATMRLIQRVGRCKSPAPSRNGAWVNSWRAADGKRETIQTWLARQGFQKADPAQTQLEFVA